MKQNNYSEDKCNKEASAETLGDNGIFTAGHDALWPLAMAAEVRAHQVISEPNSGPPF